MRASMRSAKPTPYQYRAFRGDVERALDHRGSGVESAVEPMRLANQRGRPSEPLRKPERLELHRDGHQQRAGGPVVTKLQQRVSLEHRRIAAADTVGRLFAAPAADRERVLAVSA